MRKVSNRVTPGTAITYPALMNGAVVDHEHGQSRTFQTPYAHDARPAPVPTPAMAVRRSLAALSNVFHVQYHIDPSWGYRGNAFPRFSLLGTIGAAGLPPTRVRAYMVPQRRYTRVLRYPRNPATPGIYGQE